MSLVNRKNCRKLQSSKATLTTSSVPNISLPWAGGFCPAEWTSAFCRWDTYFRSILQMWVNLAFPEPQGSIKYWESITMARTAPIRGASSCSTEMATSMHIPFGKSVLHVLQQHIGDGITLVTKLLGTRVRTRIKDTVCLSACPYCCLQCHWTVLGGPGGVSCSPVGSLTMMWNGHPSMLLQAPGREVLLLHMSIL